MSLSKVFALLLCSAVVAGLAPGCSSPSPNPDAGAQDSGGGDAGPSDAGALDAGQIPDAGFADAGSQGPSDAGSPSDGGAAVDLTALPIGDGKYGTSAAMGTVFSCQTTFGGIGGASKDGPWIDLDAGTFDYSAKVVVQGSVSWPTHSFTAVVSGSTRDIMTNDLPDHDTGTFPIARTDPAYAYDQNPNSITAQSIVWSLPQTPVVAASPTCLGGGPIGVMLSGALLYDALDGEGRDAVAHETQDLCQAHPDMSGSYHYHWVSSCLPDPGTGHSALLGYARDGFGIYGPRGEDGGILTNADLDECHGHTHAITWDGATVTMYHYHATYEFPYSLGCYRGTPQ